MLFCFVDIGVYVCVVCVGILELVVLGWVFLGLGGFGFVVCWVCAVCCLLWYFAFLDLLGFVLLPGLFDFGLD